MAREEKRRALLETMPKGGVCAEIGVWDGVFSEEILEITEPKRLHLIDPWAYQPEFKNSAFGRSENEKAMELRYHAVLHRFINDPRVAIHRAMSHDALAAFEDGSLDWVYIDGNHNYEIISQDLELCLKKVKPTGIISGDDFFWKMRKGAPVRTAVRETEARLGDRVAFSNMGQQWMLQLNLS